MFQRMCNNRSRRSIAVIAGGSLAATSAAAAHHINVYTIAGIGAGVVVGVILCLLRRGQV